MATGVFPMIVLVVRVFSDHRDKGADRDTVSYNCHEFLGPAQSINTSLQRRRPIYSLEEMQ